MSRCKRSFSGVMLFPHSAILHLTQCSLLRCRSPLSERGSVLLFALFPLVTCFLPMGPSLRYMITNERAVYILCIEIILLSNKQPARHRIAGRNGLKLKIIYTVTVALCLRRPKNTTKKAIKQNKALTKNGRCK